MTSNHSSTPTSIEDTQAPIGCAEIQLPDHVCSPTDAIERWLPELTLHLATPSAQLKDNGLHWGHFPTTGVAIQMPDGSQVQFERAFHVPKDEDPLHIAVFTEEDGCHELWLNPACLVNIVA